MTALSTVTLPLPVTLLVGYLGAGKTTLLNRLLSSEGERIIVMVNDFGEIGIDEALISDRANGMIRLNNGCICCSMAGGIFAAFEQVLALRDQVDRLVIEASGVAEPARLASFAMAEPDFDCRAVVAVVDPATIYHRLADPLIGSVVQQQILGADVIYLSRADIVPGETLAQLTSYLGWLHPQGIAVSALAPLLQAMAGPHQRGARQAQRLDHEAQFARASLIRDTAPARDAVMAVLAAHAGHIHRAKGLLRDQATGEVFLVEIAGGRAHSAPLERHVADGDALGLRLVAISPEKTAVDQLRQAILHL